MTDPIAEALDKFVPAFQSAEGDWQAILSAAAVPARPQPAGADDVIGDWRGRLQGRRPRRLPRIGRTRPHRPLRLAIVVALILLLLAGVATATYLLVRGNGKIAVIGRFGSLLAVNSKGLGLHTIARCTPGGLNCAIVEPAWSPDGRQVAFVRGGHSGVGDRHQAFLYVAAADGGGTRRLASCGLCGHQWGSHLAWSPDGRWIAFSADAGHQGQESLWIAAAAGGSPRRLTDCGTCVDVQPTWSPDGRLLIFQRLLKQATSGGSGLFTIRPTGSGLTRVALVGAEPAWSPDGRRIAFDRGNGIEVANADGSHAHELVAGKAGSGPGVPSWSPDGRKLVFFKTPGRPGYYRAEVWTMNSDGSDKKRLYGSNCCVGTWAPPIWSPNGRLIAFSADSAGGTFVINADGSHLRRLSRVSTDQLSWQRNPRR